jgi:hypothetical protein
MKARLVFALAFLLPVTAFSAPAGTPTVVKGPHYTVTSWAGPAAAQTTLDVMEALVARYNSLFLFDLSKAPAPWNVVLYATKDDFDASLAGQVSAPVTDYIYLHYADPSRSVLAAWIPAEGSPVDEVRSLAFQGFFQFLWTFLPHPPAWVETGLATVFWNSHWDGKTLTANPELPFLEALQERWKDKAPDLKALLNAPEGSLDATSGKDLEAWGLAAFLLETPDPAYARLFGSALAALSPTATEEANRAAVAQRFQAAKDLAVVATDLQAYWNSKQGFQARIDQGMAQFNAKNLPAAAASFQAALALRPTDDGALYWAGLTAYETKDYTAADGFFGKVAPKALPAGLLAYARGLTAFALKQNDAAKAWLTQAATEDATAYGKLTAPVLDLIK